MTDQIPLIIAKAISNMISDRKKKNGQEKTENLPEGEVIHRFGMTEEDYYNFLMFEALDLSDPEQEQQAVKMAMPKDKKDEKRVYNWCRALMIIPVYNFGKNFDKNMTKEDFVKIMATEDFKKKTSIFEQQEKEFNQKALLCVNNLLKINDKKWEYWYQYSSINKLAHNIPEAIKGIENALKLNKRSKMLKAKRSELIDEKIFE